MKRREFLSITGRTAAALTAVPVAVTATNAFRHGGLVPRHANRADCVISAESLLPGHPDKLADLIADTLIDAVQDAGPCWGPRGAVDVFACRDLIVVAGRIVSGFGPVPEECADMIRQLLADTGFQGCEQYVPDAARIEIRLPYIEALDDMARGINGEPGPDVPAGVYGYATDETPALMPLPTLLAHRLAARAEAVRQGGVLPWLLPHGRTKVGVRYLAGEAPVIDSVELQLQHLPRIDYKQLWEAVVHDVLLPVLPEAMITDAMRVRINPHGYCIFEGLLTQAGVSGRAVAADTYGAHCPAPANGLSGQGTVNVERSGTLMARYVAKHVVAAGLARRCTLHLAYSAATPEPDVILVDTHGTGAVPEERIEQGIREVFPLTPLGIFKHLDLGRPIYRQGAVFGYFGREEPALTWEQLDLVDALQRAV